MRATTSASASLIVLMAAMSALAIDLTTNSNAAPSAVGRYTVCVGRDWGETTPFGCTHALGVCEYLSANQYAGWCIADGDPDSYTTTYGGISPDFIGYRFKLRAATVTGLYWDSVVFWDGGTFAAAPAVQYLTDVDGPWQAVPTANVTWVEPYNPAFSNPTSHRTYHINLEPPLINVWGIRLIGTASAGLGSDVDGFVGVAELAVYGTPDVGDIDLSTDLAAGGQGIMSTSQLGDPNALVDDDLWSYDTTWGGIGAEDYLGVIWTTPQYKVRAMGVFFAHFLDGGYFSDECSDPLRIEYSTDGGASWSPVVGLHKGRYTEEWNNLATWRFYSDGAFLFAFDELNGITGLRIIGKPAGFAADTDGFVAAYDLDVFGAPPVSKIVNYDGSPEGDVDDADLGLFLNCRSGPAVPVTITPDCRNRDLDKDGDVDGDDFGIFQRCFSGEGVAANPVCGE